ncbi:MAG: hypothetical protein AAF674_20325 [Pseudomonadota bacterium]
MDDFTWAFEETFDNAEWAEAPFPPEEPVTGHSFELADARLTGMKYAQLHNLEVGIDPEDMVPFELAEESLDVAYQDGRSEETTTKDSWLKRQTD